MGGIYVTTRRNHVYASVLALSVCIPAAADVLQYGDGTADGKKSLGGSGHLILFDAQKEGRWLNKIEVFGARYGHPQPPNECFHVFLTDVKGNPLRDISVPYALWERGKERWVTLPVAPMQVSKLFGIGLGFFPTRTKGVFVGTDNVDKGYSYMWVPKGRTTKLEGAAWMVRATVEDEEGPDPQNELGIDVLHYGNGIEAGKKSIGGGGHLILFDAGKEGRWLTAVEVLGSRYGHPQPPQENFHLYVTDAEGGVVEDIPLPYKLWMRSNSYWCQLSLQQPVQVPKEFGIGLNFSPGRTKGVYVCTEEAEESHSYTWLPGKPMKKLEGSDWLVRPMLQDEQPKGGVTEVPGG